ncbi:hypothetical protein ACFFMR_02630 [Micromonospora andamanensis]|nr:hypothetical protein [Micromonospora andamanensis]
MNPVVGLQSVEPLLRSRIGMDRRAAWARKEERLRRDQGPSA